MAAHKIIIGIRTYNILYYIEQCLDSVYNQTIKDDIKVVLVDDCSTDETLSVINNWILNHLDFHIDIHTNIENQGAGVMLMQLLKYIENTEYVIILDGDDFYTKNECLEYMYNFIKKHDFDFVKFSNNIDYFHVKNLIKYDLYKLIKFNPFRYGEDHYDLWLRRITNNYVLHNYDFYYYRNRANSLTKTESNTILNIFDDIYYHNIPEASEQLQYMQSPYIDEDMLNIKYEIHPGVLVLTKNTELTEWINHYKKLGFERIFILDNNDTPLIYDDVIPYNNIPLINYLEFLATAYDHALRVIKKTNINYLLVVDDDEYLDLKDFKDILDFIYKEMLINGKKNCDFIWEVYDDNDIIYEPKGNIQDLYTRKITYGKSAGIHPGILTKSLFRILPETTYCNSNNPGHNPGGKYVLNPVDSIKAVIKHYRMQCLETFLKNKVLHKNFNKGVFGSTGLLTSFFYINKCSLEKLEAYKELCNKYNINYDVDEYNLFLNLANSYNKLAVVIPILKKEDLKFVRKIRNCDIILASLINIEYSDDYKVIKTSGNIYDCLNHAIRLLNNIYTAIIFPNSKTYPNKLSTQLEFLKNNPQVDLVTCDCLVNGIKNNKPIVSTVMFKTESFKRLPLAFEHYYDSYDKFFVNCKELNVVNIDKVLQEEEFINNDCVYDIYNLENLYKLDKPLTAIITFQNEGIEVEKTVLSIRATTKEIPIILIDDASSDGYDYNNIANTYHCLYIKNNTNIGVAASRDLGVKNCNTPYFVLLDGHMRFYDLNWDLLLINLLLDNPKRIICSNSCSINKRGDIYINELKSKNITFGAYIDMHPKRLFKTGWAFNAIDPGNITKIPAVLGACYASSKYHWELIDGLNGLIKYGYDEALMSIKTWLCGGECLLIKDFYTGHLYRQSFPYNINLSEVYANLLFLAKLFDVDSEQLIKSLNYSNYARAIKLLNLRDIEHIKAKFNLVQKYPFDYFLNINDKIIL